MTNKLGRAMWRTAMFATVFMLLVAYLIATDQYEGTAPFLLGLLLAGLTGGILSE